jgi:hypothetical protein
MNNLLIIAGLIIGWIYLLLGSFFTFDQLVRLEYRLHLSDWENDGRPYGFFWFPFDYCRSSNFNWFSRWKSQFNSSLARQRLARIWLFSTPQWMEKDEGAMKLVKRLRILDFIYLGSIILGFISIMMIGIFFS